MKISDKHISSNYLGLLQLPLIARLSGFNELIADEVNKCIELYGLSGDYITIIPKHGKCDRKLKAKTPLIELNTTISWTPNSIVDEMLKLYMYLGLIKKGLGRHAIIVNSCPWNAILVKDNEIFLLPPSSIYDYKQIHPVISRGKLVNEYDSTKIDDVIVRSMNGKLKIYSIDENSILLKGDKLTLLHSHDHYNVEVYFQQPFCIAKATYSSAKIKSQLICITMGSKVLALASSKPIELNLRPGEVSATVYSELYIELSKDVAPLRKLLNIAWSLVNKPTILRDYNAIVKSIRMLEFRPSDILINNVEVSANNHVVKAIFHLVNFSDEYRLVEAYFPAKVVSAALCSLDKSSCEELESDYNIVRIPLSPWSYRLLFLELRRLPPILLRSMEKQKLRI